MLFARLRPDGASGWRFDRPSRPMALLHYQNLGHPRPDKLLQSAFYGLQPFFLFLDRTKKFLESPKAVLRLAWAPVTVHDEARASDDGRSGGVWVQLDEPANGRDVPETTFRAFLDENVKDVYEEQPVEERNAVERRPGARVRFLDSMRIRVLGRDVASQQLQLERRPQTGNLLLRPNTWALQCQIKALRTLQDSPTSDHMPLLHLVQPNQHANWPWFEAASVADWMVLTDLDREGTEQQRHFVQIALGTPDFAFLEGPPGSGKTTAICELVLQLVRAGKRVLLCASTHVAVDNVLERLMSERNEHRDMVIPVRIGDEGNVAEGAKDWQLKRFLRTERQRLLERLDRQKPLSGAQRALREELQRGETAIERLVLDAANLVCGTTIGLLQHPDMKARAGQAEASFDVLILDEASKTTFQEFLVPALWAKRWVIVGDPKQLSPFVDEAAMASNIEACLPDPVMRDACMDVFEAARGSVVAVAVEGDAGQQEYLQQAQARGVQCAHVSEEQAPFAQVVVGSIAEIEANLDRMPLDVGLVRAPDSLLPVLRRRAAAWRHAEQRRPAVLGDWAEQVGWRLVSLYEQRWSNAQSDPSARRTASQKLEEQIELLMPAVQAGDGEPVRQQVARVRRVALPSLLESLQHGFERGERDRHGTALTDGIPQKKFEQRHVLLQTQHRMHPEIAEFARDRVYGGNALQTPSYLESERHWTYPRYSQRSVWQHTDGRCNSSNVNPTEVQLVMRELMKFDEWAATNMREDGLPWEVAVLPFYRGQEKALRQELRRWSGLHQGRGHFRRGPKGRPYLLVELCTVDRFQGHEADLVILSIVKSHPTYFLESPNRWNVALTRARFQRVIVGNRHAFRKSSGLLGELASVSSWEQSRPEDRQ